MGIIDSEANPVIPKAFINYLIFDEKMNLVTSESGAIQIGATLQKLVILHFLLLYCYF